MNKLFAIQLISSFVLGGLVIALQTYIAERVSSKMAGIIVALPSTIIVNFFFLGLVTDSVEFNRSLALVPITLAVTFVIIVFYIILAKWLCQSVLPGDKTNKQRKKILILISFIVAIALWLLLSLPLAIYQFNDLSLSLIAFVLAVIFTSYAFRKLEKPQTAPVVFHYSLWQQIGRAIFAGIMVALTVYLGKMAGAFWATLFSMFPAAFMSNVVIFHYYYEYDRLLHIFNRVPLGSISLLVYALIASLAFPRYGVIVGTIQCIVVSYGFSTLLHFALNKNR